MKEIVFTSVSCLQCLLLFAMMPPEIVGEQMEPEKIYDAVNVILSLQVNLRSDDKL